MIGVPAYQCYPFGFVCRQYGCDLHTRPEMIVINCHYVLIIAAPYRHKGKSAGQQIFRCGILHKSSRKHHAVHLMILDYPFKLSDIVSLYHADKDVVPLHRCHPVHTGYTAVKERQIGIAVIYRPHYRDIVRSFFGESLCYGTRSVIILLYVFKDPFTCVLSYPSSAGYGP